MHWRWLTALVLLALAAPAAAEDNLGGIPVVDALEAAALPAGQVHRRWFRVTGNSIAQSWLVPVIVVRGAKPGPKLLVTAAIHGDELSGIEVIHRLAAGIDPAALKGTLTLVPGLNAPGLLHHTRGFTPGDGRDGENLNRLMPGKDGPGASAAEVYARKLWVGLLHPNADAAVDLHTQSRGTEYVMYAFASTPETRRMASLAGPDMIKIDTGVAGAVETEMVKDGVPAITLELGRPELFDMAMAARAVAGIERIMAARGMLASAPPPADAAFIGNSLAVVRTQSGGFAKLDVVLGAAVTKGQPVARVSDAFGRTLEVLTAPESGRVNMIATDPLREPGDSLLRILFLSSDPKCADGC